jgi:hypothetical protein
MIWIICLKDTLNDKAIFPLTIHSLKDYYILNLYRCYPINVTINFLVFIIIRSYRMLPVCCFCGYSHPSAEACFL